MKDVLLNIILIQFQCFCERMLIFCETLTIDRNNFFLCKFNVFTKTDLKADLLNKVTKNDLI